jgi:hypothetical protein
MKTLTEFLLESTQEFVGVHYSTKPNLGVLAGAFYGRGIKGKEADRVALSNDQRIKKRVYFYPKPTSGLPYKEAGLGNHAYEYRSSKMYDAMKGDQNTKSINKTRQTLVDAGADRLNAFESAVLNHGYEGYHTDQMAVVLGKDVEPKYLGHVTSEHIPKLAPQTVQHKQTFENSSPNKEGEHSSELLSNAQMFHAIKNRDDIKAVAPSFKIQYGRAIAHSNDVKAVANHFNQAGIPL